ncbi:MAG: glycosyltransferase [Syntrophales bacterium]|nr:glycosyltransferase [Syntrophales bacterium]
MIKISCIMIVKDEENCLARCLSSVRDYVDEIIVVDTGSTDRSVEIASSFKARVYHHPWQNDFSLHRNQSISYATGDWLLQMDADEELYPGDGPLLKELALHGGADYYYFLFYDLDKNGLVHGVFNQIRFFRHGLGMHYTRKVHNQLITCGRGAFSSIRIRHYGYDLDREKMEQKHLRTTTLLKETIAASPEEPFNYYELAASYSMHRDFKEAIDYGEKAIKLCKKQGISDGYLATAFYIVAQGHYTLGNLQEAKRTCIDALTIFPEHLDSYYILAAVFFKEGDGKNCRASSLKYLELHEKIANDPASIGNLYLHCLEKKHEICLGLGITEMKANRKKSGEKYIQESYKSAPHKAAWAEKIALSLTHAGYLSEAIKWFYIAWEGSLPPLSLRAHPYLYAAIARHALSKENLIKAQAAIFFIPEDARTEKLILLSHLAWRKGEIGDMIEPLSHLIKEECIDTLSLLNDLDDLGRVLYDIAEDLGKKAHWLPARDALALAVEVSPHLFDYQRFSPLFDKSTVQ